MRKFISSQKVCLPCFAIILCLLLSHGNSAHAWPAGFQEYYVLGNETHVLEMFRTVQGNPQLKASVASVVTIVATADYQMIYYDHWEDGYERDILNPDPNSSTQLFRPVRIRETVSLNSDGTGGGIHSFVPVLPRGTDLRYDSGDRIFNVGGPINVVHSLWPEEDSYVGGTWEVYPVNA